MSKDNRISASRVAVLAVHGVADQRPEKTARQTAALLLGEQFEVNYQFFNEEKIHVALDSIHLDRELQIDNESLWSFTPVQSSCVSHGIYQDGEIKYQDSTSVPVTTLSCEEIEHESMREQLQAYKPEPDDAVHETIVLKGTRQCNQTQEQDCSVDIYESYWADLSRLKKGYFTIFFEFYLFLFFFSRIGGITVERAVAYFDAKKHWRILQKLHWFSEVSLVIGIPLSYLALLSLWVSGAPYFIQSIAPVINLEILFLVMLSGLIVISGAVIGCFLVKNKTHDKWLLIFYCIFISALLAVFPARYISYDLRYLVFLLWVYFAAIMLYLCFQYDKRRPGAFLFGSLFFGITGMVFIIFLVRSAAADQQTIFTQGVEATRWVINLNMICWVVFVFSTLFASVTGCYAIAKTSSKDKDLAKQSVWTQTLSLILPGTLIMLVSFCLLQALNYFANKFIPGNVITPLQGLIDEFIFPHLSHALGILSLAVMFALWMVSPALFFDKLNPTAEKRSSASAWIGINLSNAYKKMRWVGELFRFMLLVALPIEWFLHMVPDGIPHHNIEFHRNIVLYGGLSVVFIMFASKGPLSFLGMGFRAGLDVGLDVANWMRFRPRESNPRASIVRRYVSILRHIANWRDPVTKKGYDKLVIVAHSQGTVITADVLRFLNLEYADSNLVERNSNLARFFSSDTSSLPIKLLTFGSPLRQLYSQRFPLQYKWAGCNTGTSVQGQRLHGPDPEKLGVTNWANLYCSGDYVGRYLWYDDADSQVWSGKWSNKAESAAYSRAKEKCLGAGGHTNYWSGDLPDVAIELDNLIHKP